MCRKQSGFTLIEILLAMFIFTIVSMIIVGALHSVFTTQSAVEVRAKRLRNLQIALTFLSRDLEQAINRPISTANGGLESAFIGTHNTMTFTHTGVMNPEGAKQRSALQRVSYSVTNEQLIKNTWPQLDLTPDSIEQKRILLKDVTAFELEYIDQKDQTMTRWPPPAEQNNLGGLPKAVKVMLTLSDLGKITQLYIIPSQSFEKRPESTH